MDRTWPKTWNWCARADLHFKNKLIKKRMPGTNRRTFLHIHRNRAKSHTAHSLTAYWHGNRYQSSLPRKWHRMFSRVHQPLFQMSQSSAGRSFRDRTEVDRADRWQEDRTKDCCPSVSFSHCYSVTGCRVAMCPISLQPLAAIVLVSLRIRRFWNSMTLSLPLSLSLSYLNLYP